MPGRGVLNRQNGMKCLENLSNDEKTHFYSFLLEKLENRIPWCICQNYGMCEKFVTNFQSLDLGALGRGRPDAKLYEFREHMGCIWGSLSIEKISICTRMGETRVGTFLPDPPNKCSIFPFLQYNYIIIFLKNQIGGRKTAFF